MTLPTRNAHERAVLASLAAAEKRFRERLEALNAAAAASAPDWEDRAACRNAADPEAFFPIASPGSNHLDLRPARAYCNRCPVKAECLAYGTKTASFGVWGGEYEPGRRRPGSAS